MNREEIRKQAEKELEEEQYREAVDKYKERLKAKKWYHKLFPYRIVFIKRD